MKEALIRLAIFGMGVGVGVLGCREYFDKKYQKLADEEIESCRAIFEKRKEKTEEPAEVVEEKDENAETGATLASLYSTNPYKAFQYHEFYKPKNVDEAQTLSPKEDELPFDISVEEYEEDNEFPKVTLNLYLEDGALIYEDTEELALDVDTVGEENLDDFVKSSFATAYFRNPKSEIDYEVIKVDGSYRELIAGDI